MDEEAVVTVPAWLEWSSAIAGIAAGVATAVGVPIALRGLTEWRKQRRHDARTSAAARIAETLLRAARDLEAARFRLELAGEGFLAATEGELSPNKLLVRTHRAIDDFRRASPPSTATNDLANARADAEIHLTEGVDLVNQADRLYALITRDEHDLSSLDGGPPSDEFRATVKRVGEERSRDVAALRAAIVQRLGPIARHEDGR